MCVGLWKGGDVEGCEEGGVLWRRLRPPHLFLDEQQQAWE